jgi:hypothetical protein
LTRPSKGNRPDHNLLGEPESNGYPEFRDRQPTARNPGVDRTSADESVPERVLCDPEYRDERRTWENIGMARIWVERYTGSGVPIDYWGLSPTPRPEDRNLVPRNMLRVAVASFTFRFVSVEQIRDCLSYYEQKTHPSSRLPAGGGDHWEFQRWFERLPMYLLEDPNTTVVTK